MSQITASAVQDAIAQIMQSAPHAAGPIDLAMARDMALRITSTVQKMGFTGPATLSGNAAFHTLLSQHLGSPAAATYNAATRQLLQQAIDKANLHGPDYLAGVRAGIQLGLQASRQERQASATPAPGDDRKAASSARFTQGDMPGTGLQGNPDLRGISMANYNSSPITRAIVDAGVNYGTFNYLRQQGFNQGNIVNAAKDAKALGFSPNDKPAVRDHAIIDKHDPKKKQTLDALGKMKKGLIDSKDFKDAAQAVQNAKTPEERKAAQAKANQLIDAEAKTKGVTAAINDKDRSELVRKAIDSRKKAIGEQVQKLHQAAPAGTAPQKNPLPSDPRTKAARDALYKSMMKNGPAASK